MNTSIAFHKFTIYYDKNISIEKSKQNHWNKNTLNAPSDVTVLNIATKTFVR